MPSLETYKKILGVDNNTPGRLRKNQSDKIIETTWDRDIASHTCYFYDYYHDDEPLLYSGLHPENSKFKIPINIKFYSTTYNSENKDQVGYHIQFKPSFDWHNEEGLSYYQENFVDKYEAEFPIGLIIAQ